MVIMNYQFSKSEKLIQSISASILNDINPLFSELRSSCPSLPPFDHCIGTNRFLGTLYGLYIREWSTIQDDFVWEQITKLSMYLRIVVVLDDFARDNEVNHNDLELIHNLCDLSLRFANEVITSIISPSQESMILLPRAEQNTELAYNNVFLNHPPSYNLVVEKCSLVRVPIQVVSILDKHFPIELMDHIVSSYLFSLQCLDDYYDIQEDYNGRINSNLFIWSLEPSLYLRFENQRQQFLPAIARYVQSNVNALIDDIHKITDKRGSLVRLLEMSVNFLRQWSEQDISSTIPITLWCDSTLFSDYLPPSERLGRFSEILDQLSDRPIMADNNLFRAENMHSLSQKIIRG
jgi:hypothetical protein